jgi:uncharacterized protein (TIGR00297 family)
VNNRHASYEQARQAVHIAAGGFALLFRYISWWEGALLAGIALAFNLYALPRMGGARLYRSPDVVRGYSGGILLYPISILLLILIFPNRLDIVAAAWGVLAVGDGMATIVGKKFGGRRLPWNQDKSIAGSVALFVFGAGAGSFLAWWCRPAQIPPPYLWYSLIVPIIAALVAAAVETLPINLDDNVSVPGTAAAVMWVGSLMNEDLIAASWTHAVHVLPVAIGLNALVATAGYAARTVSISGAICGVAIGYVMFAGAGWEGWLLLLETFLAASISSRVGLRRKVRLGIAEERGGRRGAGNAMANTGVAAIAAMMAVTTYATGPALIASVAALTAAGSDTVASEIGKAFGRRPYLVPTFARVPAGTSGAITIEGTLAGLASAVVLAWSGVWLGLMPLAALIPVVAGATLGAFAESAMGATLEPRRILNNDVLNFFNTAIAAASAVWFAGAA